jgi:hypothetical protein
MLRAIIIATLYHKEKTMKKKYECCFCNKEIISDTVDVTALIVITNYDKAQNKQEVQQLFCHIYCLKDKLPATIALYGLNPEKN